MKYTKNKTSPARMIIGFRPYRSATAPQKGDDIAPAKKDALYKRPDHVATCWCTPICNKNSGKKGTTIEKLDAVIRVPIHKTNRFRFQITKLNAAFMSESVFAVFVDSLWCYQCITLIREIASRNNNVVISGMLRYSCAVSVYFSW